MSFDRCIANIINPIGVEGVYSNDKGDAGGETVFGLDSKDDAACLCWPIVRQLQAANIPIAQWPQNTALMATIKAWYFDKYWLPSQLDYFPEVLQDECFGCAINQGVGEMAKLMQRACNRTGATLAVDGGLGPATLAAINHAPLGWLQDAFFRVRVTDYLAIVDRNPKDDAQFLHGWEERMESGE